LLWINWRINFLNIIVQLQKIIHPIIFLVFLVLLLILAVVPVMAIIKVVLELSKTKTEQKETQ
jgi:hypothetical protein